MDLNELLVFAKVVHAGSITGAAQALDMPKSTVSRKLAELERRLGTRLLQRTTRKLSLTDAGRTYHAHCVRVLAEVEQAERAVTDLQSTPRGLLRVTAPVNEGRHLGPLVADFLHLHPEVQLEMVCTDRMVGLVEEGFDMAIRVGPLADSTLVAQTIAKVHGVLVASPQYLARRGSPSAPQDLAGHDCLLFSAGVNFRRWHLVNGAAAVDVAVAPLLAVNDFDVLRESAIAGVGIAMLAGQRCREDILAGRLERVLPNWSSVASTVHAVYPSTRQLSPKVRAFADHLRQRIAQQVAAME